MPEALFQVRGLTKSYNGRTVLDHLDFDVLRGECLVILGRSGSGKSTLLRILAGLDAPSEGEVLVNGAFVSGPGRILVPPHRRGISMVFQDLALWPNLSVLGNVLLGLSAARLTRKEKHARAREALAMCSIERLARRMPGEISGGEEQRAALARAIALRTTFLFLDEPFSGLDLVTKAQIVDELKTLATRAGLTVVLVSHDPLDAMSLCNGAMVLEEGTAVEEGPLETLLRAPRSRLLEVFKERLQPGRGR